MKKLIYTIAFDAPGQSLYRNLAKLLASSILRSGFNGEIVVFHNSANPLFLLQRAGIIEYPLDVENVTGDGMSFHPEKTWALKHLVANLLHEHDWDRCYFIDADAIVLENLEPLFLGDWEVAVCREPGRALTRPEFSKFLTLSTHNASDLEGINSGIVGVDRSVSERFFAAWTENETNLKCDERACTDQIALNQLTLENNFQLFDVGHLISMPFHTDLLFGRPKRVLLEHMVGAIGHEKLKRSFGAFMETYYYDPTVTLFNLLETQSLQMIIAGVNLATQLRATGSLSVSRELHDLNQTQEALSQQNGEIALALIVCKRASYPVDQIAGGNGEWWLNRE